MSEQEKALLLSKEATPENIKALKQFIIDKSVPHIDLFDELELKKFFSRRT